MIMMTRSNNSSTRDITVVLSASL